MVRAIQSRKADSDTWCCDSMTILLEDNSPVESEYRIGKRDCWSRRYFSQHHFVILSQFYQAAMPVYSKSCFTTLLQMEDNGGEQQVLAPLSRQEHLVFGESSTLSDSVSLTFANPFQPFAFDTFSVFPTHHFQTCLTGCKPIPWLGASRLNCTTSIAPSST
jgi:hypothetical protein